MVFNTVKAYLENLSKRTEILRKKKLDLATAESTFVKNDLVPTQASPSNQLADKDFVNSSIQRMAANWVTPNIAGDAAFASLAALNSGPWFYHGAAGYTPSKNDHATFIDTQGRQCLAVFDSAVWIQAYIINDTPFTAAQNAAINSGITSALVTQIKQNEDDIVTLNDDLNWERTERNSSDASLNSYIGELRTVIFGQNGIPATPFTDTEADDPFWS